MAIGAGNARGSTTARSHIDLAQAARGQGGLSQGNPLEQSQSTDSGLDMETLMAALKSGQVSAGSLMQLLAILMGMGNQPASGNMQSIQDAGQGGPPGAPGGPASPIGAAFMGAGGGGQ